MPLLLGGVEQVEDRSRVAVGLMPCRRRSRDSGHAALRGRGLRCARGRLGHRLARVARQVEQRLADLRLRRPRTSGSARPMPSSIRTPAALISGAGTRPRRARASPRSSGSSRGLGQARDAQVLLGDRGQAIDLALDRRAAARRPRGRRRRSSSSSSSTLRPMLESGLRTSCVTCAAMRPMAARRSLWISRAWSRSSSVTSSATMSTSRGAPQRGAERRDEHVELAFPDARRTSPP